MACAECPRCGWEGSSTVCPVCLGQTTPTENFKDGRGQEDDYNV